VIAVVKAEGYGHGALPVAHAALEAGAWGLAVSTPDEAALLRPLTADDRILVMGGLAPADAADAVACGCAVMCHTMEMADALEAALPEGRRLPVHLKVDTGMSRLGCSPQEAPQLAQRIAGSARLRLAGTFTHFASAEADDELTRRQFELFGQVLDALGVDPGLRHAANSAATLRYPEMALDAVRSGIAVYGCEDGRLRPALALRALVTQVKEIPAGAGVGYGQSWRAERPTRLATIAIGYEDGVLRSRENRGDVIVRAWRAPLVGRVSMDAITVDVTGIEGVRAGDVATLIGSQGEESISAEEVAEWSGTISYEVLTSIGDRVERRYSE
jgi:alanine racemase